MESYPAVPSCEIRARMVVSMVFKSHQIKAESFMSDSFNQGGVATAGVKATSTIFLRDITKLDCALFDPSAGVVGQSWHVDVTVSGGLDTNGFVFDFSPLKKLVRQVLKSTLDHALIIPINSQGVEYQDAAGGERWLLKSRPRKGKQDILWQYRCPKGAVYPLRAKALTRSIMEQDLARSLRHRLPETIQNVSVSLRDEEIEATAAVFRYTHGVTEHEGLCQRLFHGHRSRLEVYVGDERRPDWEHYIVRDIFDTMVHVATPRQFKSGPEIKPGTKGSTPEPVTLGYEGASGFYEVVLPAHRVFVVETETSVECISRQLALLVRREEDALDPVKVICCEGIDKGAVAFA